MKFSDLKAGESFVIKGRKTPQGFVSLETGEAFYEVDGDTPVTIPKNIKLFKRLQRHINIFLFVHGWGKLSREYEQLTDAAFRAEFLLRNFGKPGLEIARDRSMNLE